MDVSFPLTGDEEFTFPWATSGSTIQPSHDENHDSRDTGTKWPLHDEKASPSLRRQWMIFSKDLNPQEIRMSLFQSSWTIFKVLKFGDWVESTLGNHSTAVAILEAHHEYLAFSLFDFISCFPLESGKYWSLLENLNPESFVYQAVLHALECFKSGGPYSDLQLNTHFITKPLQALLSEPDAHILSKLKVLEARYMRYKTGSDMIEGRFFDTGTALLNLIISDTPRSVAIKMSQNALEIFRRLSLESILTRDCNLRVLGTQWNQVCLDARELATADIQQDKMMAVARELLYMKNHFSLSAILIGQKMADVHVESDFSGFTDSTQNYHCYRTKLHCDASMPFLFPFLVDLRRGGKEALARIFSFVSYAQTHTELSYPSLDPCEQNKAK